MKIDVLCSSEDHPVVPHLKAWCAAQEGHDVALHFDLNTVRGGDVLFLISCSVLVGEDIRKCYGNTLVLHASDLPKGRGWSPHIWEILGGADTITLSMLEAEDAVDSGAIWAKLCLDMPKTALFDEINTTLFEGETALMSKALDMITNGEAPAPQDRDEASYWPKRTPADSEIDPDLSLAEQFDALRVADPDRYPAFFNHRGARYEIALRRVKDKDRHED